MKPKPILTIVAAIFFCCLAACCIIGAGYFIYTYKQNAAAPPTPVAPQTNNNPPIATVLPPTETSGAACPNLTDAIVQSAQGSVYGPDLGSFDSSSLIDSQTLVTYQVSGDQISNPSFEKVSKKFLNLQKDNASQRAAWNLFADLIPRQDRTMVSQFMVFTDGPSNILAAVEQTQDDPSKWIVEVDEADLQDKNALVFTLVHEYAHLLTLNADQVPPDLDVFNNPDNIKLYNKKAAACPTYFPGEGCSYQASYINVFYNRFWKSIDKEWQKIDNLSDAQDQNPYYDKLYAFYQKYQDQFVDDYAVTNPSEDMAETFAYFVLAPKPNGQSIRDQKILFFYEYPELVQLRSQILSNVCALKQ